MSIIQWLGSKQKEYSNYSQYLNTDHNVLVEPFCGSAITSINQYIKHGNNKKYHINDIDWCLINLYRQLKKNRENVVKNFNFLKNSFSTKEKFNSIIKEYKNKIKNFDKNELAEHFLFFTKVYNRVYGLYPDKKKINDLDINKYNIFFNFIDIAKINCKDYLYLFRKYKNNKNALLFLDPPYLSSFNGLYYSYKQGECNIEKKIIDNTKLFIDIYNFLKKAKCKILLVINDNALTRFIYKDFIRETYDVCYRLNHKKTKHLIITNY
jgi:site-specific DNA-adenine methylase